MWTLDKMPAGNVELKVAFFPGKLTLASGGNGTLEVVGMSISEFDQLMEHLSDPIAPETTFSAFLQSDGVLKDNVKTLTDEQAIDLAQQIAQTTGTTLKRPSTTSTPSMPPPCPRASTPTTRATSTS